MSWRVLPPSTTEGPELFVFAGTNGAGKSSIGGAFYRQIGRDYINPDEIARELRRGEPQLTVEQANAAAWQFGVSMLREAIATRRSFAFETTLGGRTIPKLLQEAVAAGLRLHLWYCGLASVQLHIERVAARVAKGGHDIPQAKIRERYRSSMLNLIALLPLATRLEIHDNSAQANAHGRPAPRVVLRAAAGRIVYPSDKTQLAMTPKWAQPAVARAFEVFGSELGGR